MYKKSRYLRLCLLITVFSFLIGISIFVWANASIAYGQSSSSNELIYKELVATYKTNLIRRENGLAPLRWNRELSEAAREFARDTVVVRTDPYCGHTDSQGRAVIDRIEAAGYSPIRWAENAACGYLEPEIVVPSWFESDSHRRNMLIPELREIGIGYYRDSASGAGYVVQNFAYDGIVAPIIINNEAPTTESTEVSLYIYDNNPRNGFNGIGSAVEMMISNSPYFENAQWEPYTLEKNWFLESGAGWRYVFVKKRDSIGRVTTSFDAIYLGATIPAGELTLDHASTVERQLTYDAIVEQFPQAQNWSSIQIGRYWTIDDSMDSFSLFNNAGIQQDDPNALGGTAYRLNLSRLEASYLGENNTVAAAWIGDAPANTPLVAYVRAKIENNRKSDRVLKIWAESGSTQFEPIIIKADDFLYPEIYQEFAFPVEFINPNSGDLLALRIYHYGGNEVSLDTVSYFTGEQDFNQSANWSSSSQFLRDRGFVARVVENGADGAGSLYEVGEQINSSGTQNPPKPPATTEAATPTPTSSPPPADTGLILSLHNVEIEASAGGSLPDRVEIDVECTLCGDSAWWAYSNKPWLEARRFYNDLYIEVDQSNLSPGIYEALATVGAPSITGIPVQQISIRFIVTESVTGSAPTATSVPPTATPTATSVPPTATPTATSVPPTATPNPNRDATPGPTPGGNNDPTPTPKATVKPTEVVNVQLKSRVLLPLTSR